MSHLRREGSSPFSRTKTEAPGNIEFPGGSFFLEIPTLNEQSGDKFLFVDKFDVKDINYGNFVFGSG